MHGTSMGIISYFKGYYISNLLCMPFLGRNSPRESNVSQIWRLSNKCNGLWKRKRDTLLIEALCAGLDDHLMNCDGSITRISWVCGLDNIKPLLNMRISAILEKKCTKHDLIVFRILT
jgi:hypothetical protein